MAGQIREILSGGTSWSSRYTYAPALREGALIEISTVAILKG